MRVAAVLVLFLAGLFVVLTRTQVGRDAVAGQAAAAFNRTYAGRVEVGRVTGNLVRDLYARDLRLYDPDGALVLAADSVVLRPSWRSLFRRAFQAGEIALFRPRLDLHRDSTGAWNLAEALRRRRPSSAPSEPFALHAADLRIEGGVLTLHVDGPAPEAVAAGTLFDYRHLRVARLDAELSLDWRQDVKRLGLAHAAFHLPDRNVTVQMLAGQAAMEGDRLAAEDVRFATAHSRLSGSVRIEGLDAEPTLDATLREGRVATADLRSFLPRLPMADVVTLRGAVSGSLADLRVADLRLARGETAVETSGRVRGLPDSLAFALDVPALRLREADLHAVLPTLPLPDVLRSLGLATAEGRVEGVVHDGRLRLAADLDATTEAGEAEGTIRLALERGRRPRFALDAAFDGLDPGRLSGRTDLTGALSGTLTTEQAASGDSAATTFRLRLGPSTLAGRRADSLAAEGVVRAQHLDARLALRQGDSRFDGTVRGDRIASTLFVDGDLSAFDVQRLWPTAPATRLTGPVRLDLEAPALTELRAAVDAELREAVLVAGGAPHALPTGSLRLALTPPDEPGPRLRLTSPVVEAEVDGEIDAETAAVLGPYWVAALVRAAEAAYAKPLRGEPVLRPPPVPPALIRVPQPFTLDVRLHDPAALRALIPNLPDLARGTGIHATGALGSDALTLDFNVGSDAIGLGGSRGRGVAVTGRLEQRRAEAPLPPHLTLSASADSLVLGGWTTHDVTLDVALTDEEATFGLGALRPGSGDRIDLGGTLALLPDRNRLTLTRAAADVGEARWSAAGPQVVDLYAEAAVIRALAVTRDSSEQRVAFRGVLSDAPADTLYAEVDGFDLGEIARAAKAHWNDEYPGGRLDARLAVTRLLSQPAVTGTAAVPQLRLGDHVLGRLALTSRFLPGTEAVAVDVQLGRLPPGAVIPHPLTLEESDLSIEGRLRLPSRARDGARDAGLLDLAVTAERADLFFFDYLFPDLVVGASGYATGTGRITGDFSQPLFEAELTVPEASASIPQYGLAIRCEGTARVDRRGIHLDAVRLTDEAGGTGTVAGSVLFNDYRFFSLDLRADLRAVEIVDVPGGRPDLPFYGTIRASGTATLTGPLDRVVLRSADAVTTPDSEIFIPIASDAVEADPGFLVFADAAGRVPDRKRRTSVIGPKPEGERTFSEGFEMNLNVTAPPGSTVHLVFDPRIGDVIDARGSADLQLSIGEGVFRTFGTFTVAGGSYAFVAGDVFTRRFEIEPGGALTWDGDPLDAQIDLTADYRTRASLAGLGLAGLDDQRIPLVVRTRVGGRLTSPLVSLALDLDADARGGATAAAAEALRPLLNDADRQALYATSVLLTGTFLLAPVENVAGSGGAITEAADALLFTSLSQLVSNRLNLFLSQALASDRVEVLLGVQPGEQLQDFDLTYGVALRFLDERLVIRGEGVYQQLANQPANEGLRGEVAVEVKLTPAVALEVFYRRESELLGGTSVGVTPYGAYGVGVSYEAAFTSWQHALERLLGRGGTSPTG